MPPQNTKVEDCETAPLSSHRDEKTELKANDYRVSLRGRLAGVAAALACAAIFAGLGFLVQKFQLQADELLLVRAVLQVGLELG